MTPRIICLDLRGDRIRPLPVPPARTVLCLGNFDGVHRAHAALLERGVRLARTLSVCDGAPAACGVFCFFHLSGDYFLRKGRGRNHLTTLKERLLAFAAHGVDIVFLCDFPAVRDLSPEAFLTLLTTHCGCIGAVCGYNYRFGHAAAGTPALITAALGDARTAVLPPLTVDDAPISSTRIRAAITAGDMEKAEALLGRPYALESTVIHGKSLGHTWGFPTANQYFPPERLIPPHGVYAVLCHTPNGLFPGVANVGLRPTVESPDRANCETHIIGFSGNLYGARLKVDFLKFLRPEQKFDSVEALTAAIRRDTDAAAAYVAARQNPPRN